MKKSKFLFILLAFLIVFSYFLSSNVFAITFKDENRDVVITCDYEFENPDDSYILIRYNSEDNCYTYYCTSAEIICGTSNWQYFIYYYRYDINKDGSVGYKELIPEGKYENPFSKKFSFSSSDIVFSTYDVKNSSGEVVFQKPVLTLGEVLEITNPVKKFQTMISGMIVFLVVFLVSLVGFLKAWSLLSNSLRKV